MKKAFPFHHAHGMRRGRLFDWIQAAYYAFTENDATSLSSLSIRTTVFSLVTKARFFPTGITRGALSKLDCSLRRLFVLLRLRNGIGGCVAGSILVVSGSRVLGSVLIIRGGRFAVCRPESGKQGHDQNRRCRGRKDPLSAHDFLREHIKLDADPQHQRHAEQPAERDARTLFSQQQSGCGQIGQAVDDQQRPAGERQIPEQHVRKRQHLKIREHRVHAQRPAARVEQHPGRACDRADADKQRPEQQDAPGRPVS